MSLQICAPVSVIRNEKPNNSNNTCPYKTAKVRHLPQQIQSLSAQPPLPNVKHALAGRRFSVGGSLFVDLSPCSRPATGADTPGPFSGSRLATYADAPEPFPGSQHATCAFFPDPFADLRLGTCGRPHGSFLSPSPGSQRATRGRERDRIPRIRSCSRNALRHDHAYMACR